MHTPTRPSTSTARPADGPQRWFTVQEAADFLGVNRRFVYRLTEEGRIAKHKMGRLVRLDRADLEEFIAETRVEKRTAIPRQRRR